MDDLNKRAWADMVADVRRAFAEFLTVPTLMIAGFLVLAAGMYALDRSGVDVWGLDQQLIVQYVFGEAQATSALLGTIAGSLITVTSITFPLLLLAVQQSAAALTSQVFDQFLRRRLNQAYLGFFVGLALYTLFVLATIKAPFIPVYRASLALVLAALRCRSSNCGSRRSASPTRCLRPTGWCCCRM